MEHASIPNERELMILPLISKSNDITNPYVNQVSRRIVTANTLPLPKNVQMNPFHILFEYF
jgi:hypothetical protein